MKTLSGFMVGVFSLSLAQACSVEPIEPADARVESQAAGLLIVGELRDDQIASVVIEDGEEVWTQERTVEGPLTADSAELQLEAHNAATLHNYFEGDSDDGRFRTAGPCDAEADFVNWVCDHATACFSAHGSPSWICLEIFSRCIDAIDAFWDCVEEHYVP